MNRLLARVPKLLGVAAALLFLWVPGSERAKAELLGVASFLNPEGSRLFPQVFVFPRHPGKPDLRWRTFDWEYADLSSVGRSRYRLFFYPEESWTASYAIPRINDEIHELSQVFEYEPSQQFSYLLFSSQRDFQQANVFNISEGVEGITSTTEATMAIPYWGEAETYRHISTHEMVHQFQVQKVNDISKNGMQGGFDAAPLWFVEGMAEYYSLHGVDPESRVFLRDLLTYPKAERKYELPKLIEEGELDFVHVYKVGQAKIAFLESFGPRTAQRILEATARGTSRDPDVFDEAVSRMTGVPEDELDRRWKDWAKSDFGAEAQKLSQSLDEFEEVKEAGENIDSYSVSPSGELIAVREIDPLSGVVSIRLIDMRNHGEKTEIVHDKTSEVLSLYFMERPVLALSDRYIAYIAETISGPRLSVRSLGRDSSGRLKLGFEQSLQISRHGMGQAQSPALSPDGTRIAFVGVNARGWQSVYVVPLVDGMPREFGFRRVTEGYYSWRNLCWSRDGILAASDQTPQARYNIFLLDPDTGRSRRITYATADQLAPDGDASGFVFQSLESGTPQLHRFVTAAPGRSNTPGDAFQLTEAKTEMIAPQLRQGTLYALGFRGGRFHLYRVPKKAQLERPVGALPWDATQAPWTATLAELRPADVHGYKPFFTDGTRIDSLSAFLGTGGIAGLSAAGSDLMRNYSVQADLASLGSLQHTQLDAFFTDRDGRTKWTLGGYRILVPAVDGIFSQPEMINTYLRREAGGLAALEYPLGAFSFVDLELRIAGVDRTDYSNPTYADEWNAINPGQEVLLGPMIRVGYDSILHELYTGPLKGTGVLLELDTDYYPQRSTANQRARADLSRYWPIAGRSVLAFQAVAGASWGDPFGSPYLISSDDILRAYSPFDDRLYGNYFIAGNAELHFPIGSLFHFEPLRGLAAYDLGSVFLAPGQLIQSVASSWSLGLTLNIPPVSLNFILSKPLRTAPGPMDSSVFHFTLRYLYY